MSQVTSSTKYIALDIETTGFDAEKDQILEIGAILFDEKKIYKEFSTLLNPRIQIPETITHITGIRQSDVANAPQLSEVVDALKEFVSDFPIVGHNINFDIGFLKKKGIDFQNVLYDTLTLSSIVLTKFPSYSLETIASHFKVSEKQTHRALDDTINNAKIFRILLEKIDPIPKNHRKQIEALLEKTKFPLRNFFLEAKNQRKKPAPNSSTPNPPSSILHPQSSILTQKITEILKNKKTAFIEAGVGTEKYESLATAIHEVSGKEKILIVTSSKEIAECMHESIEGSAIVQEDRAYISPERFWKFVEREKHTLSQVAFILKILFWLERTEEGMIEEVTLQGEDWTLWEEISAKDKEENEDSISDKKNSFIQKAQEKMKKAKILITQHEKFAKILFDKGGEKKDIWKEIAHCIILEADRFEEEIRESLNKKLSLKYLERKIDEDDHEAKNQLIIFFGLLGIFYEKYVKEGSTGIVEGHLKKTKEWKRVKETLEKMGEKGGATGGERIKKDIDTLKKVLLEEENDTYIILTQGMEEEMILDCMPINKIGQIWNNEIFAKEKSILIMSETLRVEKSFDYLKKRLELEPSEEIFIPPPDELLQKIHVMIPENLGDQNSEKHFRESANLIKKIMLDTPGKTIVLLSSKKNVHASYYQINQELKENGIALVCQDFSGGRGKMLERYKLDPEKAGLMGSVSFLEKIDLSILDCENLIFGKLPFEPPNDPNTLIEETKSLDAFEEYCVPRAVLRFLNIINAFLKSKGNIKNIYILDNRVSKKDYGGKFLTSLPSL